MIKPKPLPKIPPKPHPVQENRQAEPTANRVQEGQRPIRPLPEIPVKTGTPEPRPQVEFKPTQPQEIPSKPRPLPEIPKETTQTLEKEVQTESTAKQLQLEVRQQALTKRKSSTPTVVPTTQPPGPPAPVILPTVQKPPAAQRPSLRPQSDTRQILDTTAPHATPLQHTTALNRVYGVNTAKVETMQSVWLQAALNHLNAHRQKADSPELTALVTHYEKALGNINNRIAQGKDQENPIGTSAEMEQIFPVGLPKTLYKAIAKATGVPEKTARETLRNQFIRELNGKEWNPLINQMSLGTSKVPDVFTSTITPVNENYDATFAKYKKTGLNSMSTSTRLTDMSPDELNRTTNLAYTELKQDGTGRVLFRAFRSGALAGKDVSDKTQAAAVTAANTRELLQAIVVQQLKEASPTDQAKFLDAKGTDVLPVPVLSLNLQSAAWLLGGEGEHVAEQLKALKSLHGTTENVEVNWPNALGVPEKRSVLAKYDIIAMNFGVNAQGIAVFQDNKEALASLGDKKTQFVKDSQVQIDRLKIAALSAAFPQAQGGRANRQALGAKVVYPPEYYELTRKVELVGELWKRIETGNGDTSSYEMSSQLLNLGHMIGYIPHFNCKSGKDRTGLQDAEVKFMAHELDQAQTAADLKPYKIASTDPVRTEKLQTMLFASGNLEMQQYNTGGQGYKIAPAAKLLPADMRLVDRIGGSTVLAQLQGLKRYTDIDKI
jgi:phosphatidylinositol-4,5-bisphosphate 4-phosphatase